MIAWLVSAVIGSWFADTPRQEAPSPGQTPFAVADETLRMPERILVPEDTPLRPTPLNHPGDATRDPYLTPLYLGKPSNWQTRFELAPGQQGYHIYDRMGTVDVRRPSYISMEDYRRYRLQKSTEDYYRELSLASNQEAKRGLELNINAEELSDIFGGGSITIRPTGFATLDFSVDRNKTDNPSVPQRMQSNSFFNFDQQIQLGVIGQIGNRLRLNANFDTQATFQFEDQIKLDHKGSEDQIIQQIEAGNVSMQLGNSLIQGRQNLFGLKTKLRFGPVYVTGIASIERGQVQNTRISGGGAIETPFKKEASEYDAYRHFFLSHYFRSRYEAALANLPVIQSALRINRVEVWVEQQGSSRNNRNALGFLDLGENNTPSGGGQGRVYNQQLDQNPAAYSPLPDNRSNNLFDLISANPATRQVNGAKSGVEGLGLGMRNTEDFQVLGNMRRLEPNEYTVNTQLGYISLNTPVPTDQVLFIAYNYSLGGKSYQVGEFSDDVPADGLNSNVLFLKMLKSSVLRVSPYPAWDLMMKNIYNVGYGLKSDGFFLDVKYETGTSAGRVNFLPKGPVANLPLIQVLGVDRLTNNTAPQPDNLFDYVEGLTVISDRGMVIFPVLEPFGDHLAKRLNNDPDEVARYVFEALYDETPINAVQLFPQQNRFTLEGTYRSAGGGSEIPLNAFQLQEGSITVTAGGRPLTEGVDYRVDYASSKLVITDPSILSSGQDINVSYESSAAFQPQTKTMVGARAEFSPRDNLRLGLSLLNLSEQPFNYKTILGDEPVNNTLWGLDANYQKESALMTKLIDRLPLISTKEKSMIQASGEFAQFIPGAPKVIQTNEDRGVVFLDDFEAATQPFLLQGQQRWQPASFPEGNTRLFDPKLLYPGNPLAANFTRAKLAWYQVDQSFYNGFIKTIPESDLYNNYSRQVLPFELFPTASRALGNNLQTTFDLHYIPGRRGLYNYQTDPNRLDPATGAFTRPFENWAGIMREMDVNNDFEATNVEFVEFWMMDPFMDNPGSRGGEFYLNLGLVNEDLLPDETLSREAGLPGANDLPNLDTTAWGRMAIVNPPVNAFSNTLEDRRRQDIGLDGLSTEDETFHFADVIAQARNSLQGQALAEFEQDPSSDNWLHYRDPDFESANTPILDRYLDFNGQEGNSPVNEDTRGTQVNANNPPDSEDLNQNGSINFAEQYWEYRIRLHPDSLIPGTNFVIDRITNDSIRGQGGALQSVTWYQFRVPLAAGRSVNGIRDFKTISYMRMYMTGFEEEAILRMTEFKLIATQWRKYAGQLADPGVITTPQEPPFAEFALGAVSIEENSQKFPFNYVLPPGVERQAFNGNTAVGFLDNERSLVLKACGLEDGDARAIFRTVTQDLRQYEKLRMWVHAEATESGLTPSNFEQRGDASVFLRLGLDNDQNYYEYEIPLTPSDPALGSLANNIWRAENEFNFPLEWLAAAKEDRNAQGTGLIYRHAYRHPDMPEGHYIYVRGTPKLSEVRNIMIGVRNPQDPDGEPVCLEVWVNELRLTNFSASTGWAANANASIKLADLGTVNGSFSYKSAGFGPLEQRLSTRSQEDVFRYDVAANLSLEKLFPDKWGLQMPVYATYGEQRINPVFNPQEADVRTDRLLELLPTEQRQQKLEEIQDFRRTRSISFNNWRKIRTTPAAPPGKEGGGKPKVAMPWSISNFDFSFAYNEQFARSAVIERRFGTQYRGGINYRYTFPQLSVQPFKKLKFKPLSEFNFSPMPTSFSVTLMGDRQFEERAMRPTSLFGGQVEPTYAKNFMLTRNYNLTWALTRSLQLSYSANNIGRVDEVRGYWATASQAERDSAGSLADNFLHIGRDPSQGHNQLINFGRTTTFNHTFSAGYQLPFSKIKPLDFLSGTVNYSGSFNWQQAPEINPGLGGTITNQQNVQANARVDLNNFYRKFKPLKKILDAQNKKPAAQPQGPQRPGVPPAQPPKTPEAPAAEKDSVKKPDPFFFVKLLGKELLKIAMSVRSVDLTFQQSAGTILPGYLPQTDNFGLDFGYVDTASRTPSPLLPPTMGFVLGSQRDIRGLAGQNGWLTRDTLLANLFMRNVNTNLTLRTSVELFKGFRVELSANRTFSENESEFFRYNPLTGGFQGFDPLSNGNFQMSYIFANSAFDFSNPEESKAFQAFSEIRQQLSIRYAQENPATAGGTEFVTGGFRNGYLGTNQEVLISSLLASYGIVGADRIQLSAFPRIPLPNWSVNYNGLTSLPFLKKYFTSVTLRHAYRGSYGVGAFANNLNAADLDGDGYADNYDVVSVDPVTGDEIRNYYAVDIIQAVQITEQFSPLLGINLTFKNGITSQIDYKRGRNLAFNLGNIQLTQSTNEDISIMFGYRKDKLNWNFRLFGRDISMKNSLKVQLQATMRDNRDVNFTLSPDGIANTQAPITTRGSRNIILNPSVDYVVNTRVNVQVFYEQNINRPHVNNAFNTSFTSVGVRVRFTLAN